MNPSVIIQCLNEHVDTVLSCCTPTFGRKINVFKHYAEIGIYNYTQLKPYIVRGIPYAFIKDGLVEQAWFINANYELTSAKVSQSLMQAKNIKWKVQKERMKVLNLLKITE